MEIYPIKFVSGPYWRTELLAGITVAFALVPEVLAFAIIAGFSPATGLATSFVIGLITTMLGSRPGMISGVNGAMAVILVSLDYSKGHEYAFAAVVVAGVIQLLAGLLKVGRLTFFLTPPVMMGFMNGLAILLFQFQAGQFRYLDRSREAHWLSPGHLWLPLSVTACSIAIHVFLPRITKFVPSQLVAIILLTTVVWVLRLPVERVGDMAAVNWRLPVPTIPNGLFSWKTFSIVLPYSAAMAAVSSVESMLALTVLDRLEGRRSPATREVLVQGAGNLIAGFLAGMGGCAITGQSSLNYACGGRGRLSGLTVSLMLLLFMLIGAPIVERIPLPALSGVMIVVAVRAFQWKGIWKIREGGLAEAMIMAGVTIIGTFGNLAMGVISGILFTIILDKLDPKSFDQV